MHRSIFPVLVCIFTFIFSKLQSNGNELIDLQSPERGIIVSGQGIFGNIACSTPAKPQVQTTKFVAIIL